jgi:hypothetical protein
METAGLILTGFVSFVIIGALVYAAIAARKGYLESKD